MSQRQSKAEAGKREAATRPDLAELIHAVLAHPDTPAEIYNDLADSLNSSRNYGKATKSLAFIRALLGEGGDEEGGLPKSATDRYEIAAARVGVILADEETPEVLRSTLENFCAELANRVAESGECVCSPETTRRHLPAILARAEESGTICPSGGVMFEERGARD